MSNRTALILKFLLTEDEANETRNILEQLQLYEFDVENKKIENGEELKRITTKREEI